MAYAKVCWYCEKITMEPCGEPWQGWFQCTWCGATFVEQNDPAAYGLVKEPISDGRETKYRPRKRRLPKQGELSDKAAVK